MATTIPAGLEVYPLSIERYEEMVEHGILGPEDRVELLRGVLAMMTPQGARHAAVVAWLTHALVPSVDRLGRFEVRVQLPLRLAVAASLPEPDLAIVSAGIPADELPSRAHLVIEVADTSLASDLAVKADVYAAAAISEYWVIDVNALGATVHRQPGDGRYQDITHRTGQLAPVTGGLPEIDLEQLRHRVRGH